MKIYCATLVHETNRLSPLPTDLDSYRDDFLHLPASGEGAHWRGTMLDGVDWQALADARGHEVAWGLLAGAEPSRPTDAANYATLRAALLDSLRAALPVDMVALFLHGAQVADGVDDVAGDILAAVRALVGPDVPLGVVFDLHGNMSAAAIDAADVALACLEYPHVDFQDRAGQMVDLLEDAVRGRIRPITVRRRVPMIGTYYTADQPMRGLVDWAKGHEGTDGILAVSLTHGFIWADTPDCGACILVTADGDADKAGRLADAVADRWFALRDPIRRRLLPAGEAVATALALALAAPAGPVIIADVTDNPGGGAAGDATGLLSALLAADAPGSAIGMIWDPQAAAVAARSGVGTRLPLRIGGKAGIASGPPVDVEAEILCVRDDATQRVQGRPHPLGLAVALRVGNVTIIVNSIRQQVFDTACFTGLDVDPASLKLVVVKSQQHFREHFAAMAADILYAGAGGAVDMNAASLRLHRLTRPAYPLDQPPFAAFGRSWS